MTDQDYLMKEVEDENDNELDNKSSNIVSLNDESHSVVEPKEEDQNSENSNNKITIPLLSDITLKIEYGDFIGIYGATSSGKSNKSTKTNKYYNNTNKYYNTTNNYYYNETIDITNISDNDVLIIIDL